MDTNYIDRIRKKLEGALDVKYRVLDYNEGKVTLIYTDNLCDSKFISEFIITPILENTIPLDSLDTVITKVLRANVVNYVKNLDDAIAMIISGGVVMVFTTFEDVIYCEARGFPKRSVGEPKTEAVLKGPREGLTETLVDNIALIRKKVKNPDLKVENIVAGDETNTTLVIMYIKGLAPDALVNRVKNEIYKSKFRFILGAHTIDEKLGNFHSPFDNVGYTEKPDIAASKILEGRVAIIVDGTPFISTVPFFFLEFFQTPDDYYLNKYYANASRLLRWSAFIIATFLPGAYAAIITHHFSLIPSVFIFRLAVSRAGVPLPTVVEIVLMLTFFQIIKEAGLRLPQPIGQAMSIVGALILGDAATGAGITSQSTVLIVALASICYFLIPKLYGSSSLWSLILVILGSLHGLPGFYLGFFLLISHIASLDSVGYPYMFPLGTKRVFKYRDIFYRKNLENVSKNVLGEDDEA